MVNFSLKRREIIASYFGLSLFFAFVSGCIPQVVSVANIITAVRNVKQLLKICRQLSNNNVYTLNVSYEELGTFLSDKNFSTDVVQKMEQRSAYLSQGSSELRSQINQTSSAANKLFSLLKTRANQNSTPKLKSKMLSNIGDKQKVFKEKMKIAEEVLSNIDKSVQKYDDLLGYMQVATGLEQIDQYISDVDEVIVQAKALDREIQNALSENEAIVASFEAGQ